MFEKTFLEVEVSTQVFYSSKSVKMLIKARIKDHRGL